MMNGQERRPAERQDSPLTIAFLTHYFNHDSISLNLWLGITDQAREENVNLLCIPGNAPQSITGFDYQANTIYNLVDKRHVDGLLVWGSGMLGASTLENVRSLFERFRNFPIINIGLMLDDIPAVIMDNRRGVDDACSHLIERHRCGRIAFIRGPENHPEANLRYATYRECLRRHGLPDDPSLVRTGTFLRASGFSCMQSLLSDGEARPDAVFAANDLMAMGAMDALWEDHRSIPDEIKIIGFDDLDEVAYLKVPLTTIRQPFQDLGRMAVKNILALIGGREFERTTVFPSTLITRQSCGCLSPLVVQTPVDASALVPAEKSDLPVGTRLREAVTREIRSTSPYEEGGGPIEAVVAAAVRELFEGQPGFLSVLSREMSLLCNSHTEIAFFHSLLSALRRSALPFIARDSLAFLKAENLWQQGRILIGDFAYRMSIHLGFQQSVRNIIIQNINRILVTSFDLGAFVNSLAASLPSLEITTCFLSLFEEKGSFERSRLRLAFVDGRRVEIPSEGIPFLSVDIAPPHLLPRHRRTTFIIHPLYFEKEQLGFILMEEGPQVGIVNEILRAQLSAAIQGALLFQEKAKLLSDLERRAHDLQTSTTELARANADLEQFAVIASHDLKEPLRKVSLFADRLKAEGDSITTAERHDYLERMQAACLRMKTMIGDLLTYSRLSSQVAYFTVVDVSEIIADVLRELAPRIEREQARVVSEALPVLPAEPHHLRLLFRNLIDNAVKFHPPERSPRVRIFSRKARLEEKDGWEIIVEDNGLGIDEKYRDKIFGVFQRLYGPHEFAGTGMGLAVCKKIVERHGGAIRVESADDCGVRFIVVLPAAH